MVAVPHGRMVAVPHGPVPHGCRWQASCSMVAVPHQLGFSVGHALTLFTLAAPDGSEPKTLVNVYRVYNTRMVEQTMSDHKLRPHTAMPPLLAIKHHVQCLHFVIACCLPQCLAFFYQWSPMMPELRHGNKIVNVASQMTLC
jgi:hypothetical protein